MPLTLSTSTSRPAKNPIRVAMTALSTAALAIGSVAIAAPAAHAQDANVRVQQGQRIYVDNGDGTANACTIGYVDPQADTVYTAAHCGNVGQSVLMQDSNGRYHKIGHIAFGEDRFNEDTMEGKEFDFALIDYSDTSFARTDGSVEEANPYASQVAAPGSITRGDQLCFYGTTTLEQRCHAVEEVQNTPNGGGSVTARHNQHDGAEEGDSGGPMWVEGKGFVGVISRGVTGRIVWPYQNRSEEFYKLIGALPPRNGNHLLTLREQNGPVAEDSTPDSEVNTNPTVVTPDIDVEAPQNEVAEGGAPAAPTSSSS